jgi:hypothetical protein
VTDERFINEMRRAEKFGQFLDGLWKDRNGFNLLDTLRYLNSREAGSVQQTPASDK